MRSFPGHGMGSMLAGFIGFIGTLTFLGLVALLVFFLVKRAKEGRQGHPHHGPGRPFGPPVPQALQLLDERLARGEIEVDDYLSRKAALIGEQPLPNEWTPPPPGGAPGPDPTRAEDDPHI